MDLSAHTLQTLILGVIGLGGGTTVASQIIKKAGIRLNVIERDAEAVIHAVVIAITGVATVAQYVLQLHSTLPPQVLALTGTSIYGVSQLAYKWSQTALGFLGRFQLVNTKSAAGAGGGYVTSSATSVTTGSGAQHYSVTVAAPAGNEPDF